MPRRNPELFFVNCGDGITRKWSDCRIHNFLSAGQMRNTPGFFSKQIKSLQVGDIVAAYFNGKGYVGLGRIIASAVCINEFKINGRSSTQADFSRGSNMFRSYSINNNINAEFLASVEWFETVHQDEAKFMNPKPLRNVVCSLNNQPEVRKKLQEMLNVRFKDYIPNYKD